MAKSKRLRAMHERIDPEKSYSIAQMLEVFSIGASKRFNESVDAAVRLGIDPSKSDQVVRGAVVMPAGTGKSVRVAVFADGDAADAAEQSGAERIGMQDLADEIKSGGSIPYDVIIATPKAMSLVGQLGQILGPKGLMPNANTGTVNADAGLAVRNAKSGQVRFRNDKNGIIHASVGRADYSADALRENLIALCSELRRLKPGAAKGVYLRSISLSTTMGPGMLLDLSELGSAAT
ncbi:MAG: 50S ribosomal protein L1 [Gammaproteobacteria bacterium AqS3]|nr:50S ribosomal protein L1 [Gammaproteobacteria bacterium AqS3]